MLTINLLPSQERKIVEFAKTRRVMAFLAILASTLFLFASSLLLPSFLPLYFERRELERSLVLERMASAALKVDETVVRIRALQSVISTAKNSLSAPLKASFILDSILERLGNAITLTKLTVLKEDTIFLTGSAKTRRDLLNFEKMLRDSGQFQDISSPISNIIRDVDISFSIQGKIKPASAL